MVGLGFKRRYQKSPWSLLLSSLISCLFVFLSQFAMAMVPRFFSSLSLLSMLPISGLVMVAAVAGGRCARLLLGISASAPAFVFFNILFIWGVYISVIREVIPSLLDAIFNAECALVMVGLYRRQKRFCRVIELHRVMSSILSADPGFVTLGHSFSEGHDQSVVAEIGLPSEGVPLFMRVRYCSICKANVRGFDHHCPAFGNCIGQKNHRLFMILLTGFVNAEASYSMCSTKFITKSPSTNKIESESSLYADLATSTTLFCLLQMLWQVPFLMWHFYCVCFNIRTEEWINWKKYLEFQILVRPEPGELFQAATRFRNPYDKGTIGNIKEFLKSK